MSTLKLRPTFSLPFSQDANELFVSLQNVVADQPDHYIGRFTSRHAMISFVAEQRHFWSPWLNLEVRDSESGQQLFGRFSPHPSIWTGFMFAYLALSVLTFFSLILGYSQYLVSEWPWGFVLIPAWIVIALGLWLASQAGQRLSVAEMEDLKSLVENVVGVPSQDSKN